MGQVASTFQLAKGTLAKKMALQKKCNNPIKSLLVETAVEMPVECFDVVKTDYDSLQHNGAEFLQVVSPQLIICRLLGKRFDVVDLVHLMKHSGVDARVLIVTPPLPKPNMILAELRQVNPGLDVRFFSKATVDALMPFDA